MNAGVFRNTNKRHYSINSHLWRSMRNSISDTIQAPIIPNHHRQQFKTYARLPHSVYSKVKCLDITARNVPCSQFSSTATSGSKIAFVGWYLGMIKSRPILTKSITSASIYTAADLSSQTLSKSDSEPYNLVRTLRMAGYGMVIVGPTLHFWFNFVSKTLPNKDLITTLKKMVMGQAIYGPVMTAVFFSVNAALQGETGSEIIARLKRDMVPTLVNGVMYWSLCDFITFRFIPVHLQPLTSNAFGFVWNVHITYMASLEKVSTISKTTDTVINALT